MSYSTKTPGGAVSRGRTPRLRCPVTTEGARTTAVEQTSDLKLAISSIWSLQHWQHIRNLAIEIVRYPAATDHEEGIAHNARVDLLVRMLDRHVIPNLEYLEEGSRDGRALADLLLAHAMTRGDS